MEIYPATAAEKAFSYHHELPPEDLGLIGHLRGDFGSSGKEFWTTFFDAVPALKTQAFKDDFDKVIDHLRSSECGLLKSRADMVAFAEKVETCRFDSWLGIQYIFRIDTETHIYYLRCQSHKGDNNFYLWCYVKSIVCKHLPSALGHEKE